MKYILFASAFVFAQCLTFGAEPPPSPAGVDPDPIPAMIKAAGEGNAPALTALARLLESQQRQIKALLTERDGMIRENRLLREEVRRLNETLDSIRARLGNGEARPTSNGSARTE